MELALSKKKTECYELALNTLKRCEETMETIVPDYLPDVGEILSTGGVVMVRDKELSAGRASLSGVAEITAVYAPEGENCAKKLTLNVPFSCAVEDAAITGNGELIADVKLLSADVRLINPRKVLGKAEAAVRFVVYEPCTLELTQDAPEETGAEKLFRTVQIAPVVAVNEKSFSVSDELEISAGKPPVEEILSCSVTLGAEDCKFVGGRGVVHGVVRADVLYAAADCEIVQTDFELPFTYTLEAGVEVSAPECCVTLMLTGYSIETLAGENPGKRLSIAAYIAAQVTVSDKMEVTVLEDIYGIDRDIAPELKCRKTVCGMRSEAVRISCREECETPASVKSVCFASAEVGEVTAVNEGGITQLTASVRLCVIYLDENGAINRAGKKAVVTAETELPPGAEVIDVTAACDPGTYALATSGGTEVRFALSFCLTVQECADVSVVDCGECACGKSAESVPSVVLKSARGGSLWELAKKYRSSVETIARINSLEGSAAPKDGRMLLIPKKRA